MSNIPSVTTKTSSTKLTALMKQRFIESNVMQLLLYLFFPDIASMVPLTVKMYSNHSITSLPQRSRTWQQPWNPFLLWWSYPRLHLEHQKSKWLPRDVLNLMAATSLFHQLGIWSRATSHGVSLNKLNQSMLRGPGTIHYGTLMH